MKQILARGLLLGFAVASAGAQVAAVNSGARVAAVRGAGPVVHTAAAFRMVPRAEGLAAWKITLGADGAGTYQEGDLPAVTLRVSQPVWARLEAGSGAVEAQSCETRQKNIAQTGQKTVMFAQGTAEVSCTFNYSDDDALNRTAETFSALAATMQYGAKLRHDRRFDHLGLAADMDVLVKAVRDGRAIELGNIASILQGLMEDEEVIGVVRRHARDLMEGTVPAAAGSGTA